MRFFVFMFMTSVLIGLGLGQASALLGLNFYAFLTAAALGGIVNGYYWVSRYEEEQNQMALAKVRNIRG